MSNSETSNASSSRFSFKNEELVDYEEEAEQQAYEEQELPVQEPDQEAAAPAVVLEEESVQVIKLDSPPPSPPPPKKRVGFSTSVPLDKPLALAHLLFSIMSNDNFDSEDAERVMAVLNIHRMRASEDKMRRLKCMSATDRAKSVHQDLSCLIDERETVLEFALTSQWITDKDDLFEYFVRKQATLVKQRDELEKLLPATS